MWDECKLYGDALDAEVAKLEGFPSGIPFAPSAIWADGGPIIERDQIFISPPSDIHVHGGPNAGWHRRNFWTATVSARTRTYPNPNDPKLPPVVGRGAGPTPLVAAMRAYVASKGA